MKIAYNHLLSFLKENPNINDISNSLYQLGHEHEIENEIFDIEFTPNRGDCLSLLGLSRDLNLFYETDTKLDLYQKEFENFQLNFFNEAKIDCPRISFLTIKIDGDVRQYKDYLEKYFVDLKISKNNFFTDVSNYLAYEMGQPTHVYDRDKVNENHPIILTRTNKPENFLTLLGKEIKLEENNLIFYNGDIPINFAGIMGGAETACSDNTKNVLIECAYFKPESIIGNSVKYDLNSDASHKFERGVDPTCHENVLRRFIKIVMDHANVKEINLFNADQEDFKNKEIKLDFEKIIKIIGNKISQSECELILSHFGFKISEGILEVPSYRNDINNHNDLAEEILRAIGYDNIKINEIKIPKMKNTISFELEEKIKEFLIDHGFYEVVNSPFTSKSKNSIQIDNPLDSNRSYLRTNTLDSLVDNLLFNERRQKDSIKLFEISDIYIDSKEIMKQRILGIVATGRQGKNYKEFSKKIDRHYLNSIFSNLSKEFKIEFKKISRDKLNSKKKSDIFAIEIPIDQIPDSILKYKSQYKPPIEYKKYKPISEFPFIARDVSFSVTDISKLKELEKTILNYDHKYIKEIFIFDFFENIKLGVVKLGFRFIFQSNKKTLKDKDVDNIMKDIIKNTNLIEGVEIPGII